MARGVGWAVFFVAVEDRAVDTEFGLRISMSI